MPADQLDAWVRAYLEDVFNRHNLQSLDNYMTDWSRTGWATGSFMGMKRGERRWPASSMRFPTPTTP